MVISLPLLVLVSAYASEEHTWIGSILNAAILAWRIRAEEKALQARREARA